LRPEDRTAGAVYGGPSYLPDTWRAAARVEVDGIRDRVSFGIGNTIHSGDSGLYGPEDDEWYDLARQMRYLRINSTTGARSYLRVGPVERVTLGSGALVRGYRTTAAWDERRIGVEGAIEGRRIRLAGFSDDVLGVNGVVGVEARIASGARIGPVRSIGLTLAGVHDLGRVGIRGDSSLTGVEATLRGTVTALGPVAVRPFATYARYLSHGSTLGGGVDVSSSNVADVLRVRGRVAAFGSSSRFEPGHVGAFYAISNDDERIVDDRTFFDEETPELAATPLDSLSAGVDVIVDLRLLAFGRVEASQHFRRHIGDDAASAFAFRVAGRLPGGGALAFELHREDFRGIFDLIQDLGAVNSLLLDVRVPVGRRGMVFVRSRYGYRRLTETDGAEYADGPRRYLVERRFEPIVGLRFGG
ncbi:MAG: hypothetical protein AAGK21_09770, partial [Bacteroidota bacterium]